jgi:cyclophilin family peptidyl-prolyl cis-trans isomerase
VRAQTVGIDVASPLLDPRDPFGAEKGIVWGGRDRCDPTDVGCQQGGVEGGLSEVQPSPATPEGIAVSDRVKLSLSVAGEPAGDCVIGLWGDAAPTAVQTFLQLTRGTLAPAEGDAPASYARSVMVRISKDKEVVLGQLKDKGGQTMLIAGQTRPKFVPVAPPLHDDTNPISHTQAGLVSVKRGGGSFEFSISTRAAPSLDKDELVIGQVLEGMELVERLNILPTNNYNSGPMATVRIERLAVL